jgi:hypothetical protein
VNLVVYGASSAAGLVGVTMVIEEAINGRNPATQPGPKIIREQPEVVVVSEKEMDRYMKYGKIPSRYYFIIMFL